MTVLLDSDVLSKLCIAHALEDGLTLLGSGIDQCRRLPALPHMLRKGALRRHLGHSRADLVLETVSSIRAIERPDSAWLDRLAAIDDIDPGEAQLFASAADSDAIVVTGDKRALRALDGVADVANALQQKAVAWDMMLLALCQYRGVEAMRQSFQSLRDIDRVIEICFSPGNTEPEVCLKSYSDALARDLAHLDLKIPAP